MSATLNMPGIDRILAELEGEMDAATKETAEDVRDLGSQFAPEDTGELSESGEVEQADGGYNVVFGRDLPDIRAIAQEFGTADMEAQPYLGPAVRETDPTFRARQRLQALIARSGK